MVNIILIIFLNVIGKTLDLINISKYVAWNIILESVNYHLKIHNPNQFTSVCVHHTTKFMYASYIDRNAASFKMSQLRIKMKLVNAYSNRMHHNSANRMEYHGNSKHYAAPRFFTRILIMWIFALQLTPCIS